MPGERPEQVRRPLRLDAERLDAAPDLGGPRSAVSRIYRLDPERSRILPLGDGGGRRSATIRCPRGRAAIRGRRPAADAGRCAIQRDDAGHRRRSRDPQASQYTLIASIRHRAPLYRPQLRRWCRDSIARKPPSPAPPYAGRRSGVRAPWRAKRRDHRRAREHFPLCTRAVFWQHWMASASGSSAMIGRMTPCASCESFRPR